MEITKTNFFDLTREQHLRLDPKYHNFRNEVNWDIFETQSKNLIPLSQVLTEEYEIFKYVEGEEYKGVPTGQSYIDEDGDIVDYDIVTRDNHPNRLKYKINNKNIIMSSLRFAKAPATSFPDRDLEKYVFSNGFYVFKVDKSWNKKFVKHILKNYKIKELIDNNLYTGIGISSYRASDLLKVEIPTIPLEIQNTIAEELNIYEDKIKENKKQIVNIQEIVDRALEEVFNFDYETFNSLIDKDKINYTTFNAFSNNIDLRFSPKFHRASAKFVNEEELRKNSYITLKDAVDIPIVTGQTVRGKDYDDDGEVAYVTMAAIKSWELDSTDVRYLSDEYVKSKSTKTPRDVGVPQSMFISTDDILMMRSGEGGIGKVAIVNENLHAIFADFIIRIRPNKKIYNPEFMYYYFRSTYFQYLIETNKKGLGNNTNIFPVILNEFPIPYLSLQEQRTVVNKINEEIKVNKDIEKKNNFIREKIDRLMIETLNSY